MTATDSPDFCSAQGSRCQKVEPNFRKRKAQQDRNIKVTNTDKPPTLPPKKNKQHTKATQVCSYLPRDGDLFFSTSHNHARLKKTNTNRTLANTLIQSTKLQFSSEFIFSFPFAGVFGSQPAKMFLPTGKSQRKCSFLCFAGNHEKNYNE